MLVNLLSNAVKFTPNNGKIGLEVSPGDEDHTVCFTVWDTGIGIPADKLDLLFQPFMQLDSSLARHYTGTGLGLVLVRRLAELHGGTVRVNSQPGIGSRFIILLPLKLPDTQPASLSAKAPTETEGIPVAVDTVGPPSIPLYSYPQAPKRQVSVLLADDDNLNQKIISGYLTAKGYKVTSASDGHAAIQLAKEIRPDLILMDIQMPDMDGLEAMRRLRLLPEFSSIPIIALTALAMQGDRDACLTAGANEYMTKPVKLQALTRMIDLLLEQNP